MVKKNLNSRRERFSKEKFFSTFFWILMIGKVRRDYPKVSCVCPQSIGLEGWKPKIRGVFG